MPLTQRLFARRGSSDDGSSPGTPGADSTDALDAQTAADPNDAPEVSRLKGALHGQIARAKAHKHHHRRWYTRARFLFPLGITLGLLAGFALIEPSDIQALPTQLSVLLNDLPGALPALDFSRIDAEWQRLRGNMPNLPEVWKLNADGREFQVGDQQAAQGRKAKYPVVLVPGVISTGLESWSTSPEYRDFFRVRVWGGFHMVSQVLFNRDKWMASLLLDPDTGLDPPGVKVRAAEGIEAASSFIQGYWLWSKIIENLAVVDYDTNNLYLAPYDWRLSYTNLERRDGYFSRLKTMIEGFKKREGEKVVLVAHSMGSTVILYFMKWVESPAHGAGGSDWVENHIEALITIAGTHLGVAKAMPAFLSGEMKDTVQMNPAGAYVLERFFSKRERQKLFLSWAGSASMWIKGGSAIWGTADGAPDDPPDATLSHGLLVSFRDAALGDSANRSEGGGAGPDAGEGKVLDKVEAKAHGRADAAAATAAVEDVPGDARNMTADAAGAWILSRLPASFRRMMAGNYSAGFERDEAQLRRNGADARKWTNPLEVQLPNAPSMKMFCVYGHGKETERSYWYARGDYENDEPADASHGTCVHGNNLAEDGDHDHEDCAHARAHAPLQMPPARKSWIDFEYTDLSANPKIVNGVKMGEGDGTVSLLSLGAMCVEGWKRKRWNPAGIKVVTVELPHNPTPTIPRGGANTSDHVDILGSTMLNEIIVKVATGAGAEVHDQFVSNIETYASRIQWD